MVSNFVICIPAHVMESFENIKESRINAVRIKETPACDPALQPGLGRGPIGETRWFFLQYEYVAC